MKKKQKTRLVLFLFIFVAIFTIFYIGGTGKSLFSIITTTKADRDISLMSAWYSNISADVAGNNFDYYLKSGTRYDSVHAQSPEVLYAIYNTVNGINPTWYYFNEIDSHENWFLHADGTDATKKENRLRDTGYGYYRNDIGNPDYWTFTNQKLQQDIGSSTINAIFVDSAHSAFRNSGLFYYVKNEPVTINDFSVTVSKDLFEKKFPFQVNNDIKITIASDGSGNNLYGGGYTSRVLELGSSSYEVLGYVITNLTTNNNMEQWESTTNTFTYPGGIKPKEFSAGYNSTVVRVINSPVDIDYSALLSVKNEDGSTWKRRLISPTYTHNVGNSYITSLRMKNIENISKLTLYFEFTYDYLSYKTFSLDIPAFVDNEWYSRTWTISESGTMPFICNNTLCNKVRVYVAVTGFKSGTNSGSVQIDDFRFARKAVSGVPITTLYATYGTPGTATPSAVSNFHNNMKLYLQNVKTNNPGKKVFFNELEMPGGTGVGNLDYIDFVDGVMIENFMHAYWGNNTDVISENDWIAKMNVIQNNIVNKSKIALMVCGVNAGATQLQVDKAFNLCYPSYLLLQKKNQSMFQFRIWDDKNEWYHYQYDYHFGVPLEDFKLYNSNPNVYGRKYTNSLVFVNPSTTDATITLSTIYKDVNNNNVSQIVVPAKSGAYVFNINDTVYVPTELPPAIKDSKTFIIVIFVVIFIVGVFVYFTKYSKKR